jgi:hypothetical protein
MKQERVRVHCSLSTQWRGSMHPAIQTFEREGHLGSAPTIMWFRLAICYPKVQISTTTGARTSLASILLRGLSLGAIGPYMIGTEL